VADIMSIDRIKQIVSGITTAYPTIKIIRENQQGNAPDLPYWSYKVSANMRDFNRAYENLSVGTNQTVDVEKFVPIQYTLSFTGHDKGIVINTQAMSIISWFENPIVGGQVCRTLGFVPRLIGQVQDRSSIPGEEEMENKIGFDIRIDGNVKFTRNIESIRAIEATLNGQIIGV